MNAWLGETTRLARLAAPVVAMQIASMMLGVVDTLMVGNYSVEAVAATSLGHLWVAGTQLIAMGVLLGMDPLVSQAHGAGDGNRVALTLQRGVVTALLLSLPVGLLFLATESALVALGQNPALAADAHRYVLVQLPSVPAFLVFVALRQYLMGRGLMVPTLLVTIAANLGNAGANWLLIYGNLGFPALGATGAGIATCITQIVLLVGLFWCARALDVFRGAWVPWSREALRPAGLLEIGRYGLPVGIQFGLELWAFQIGSLWAGRLGTNELAAHTIVLRMASLSFMVPLGISIGAVTRVGNLIGRGDREGAQRAAWVALGLGASVMAVSAVIFAVFSDELTGLFTTDARVIALGASILPIAAAFQLFDGTQVVGGGILRGMGRTRPAPLFNLIGFYVLALPIAHWLTYRRQLGLVGIWWGLALGLGIVALLLVAWVGLRGPARMQQESRDFLEHA